MKNFIVVVKNDLDTIIGVADKVDEIERIIKDDMLEVGAGAEVEDYAVYSPRFTAKTTFELVDVMDMAYKGGNVKKGK
jgi:hypothetical protein